MILVKIIKWKPPKMQNEITYNNIKNSQITLKIKRTRRFATTIIVIENIYSNRLHDHETRETAKIHRNLKLLIFWFQKRSTNNRNSLFVRRKFNKIWRVTIFSKWHCTVEMYTRLCFNKIMGYYIIRHSMGLRRVQAVFNLKSKKIFRW